MNSRLQALFDRPIAGLAILALLGALLYFPSFAADELDDEEGRRALPAREMVESGDYVVPTLWGKPYLHKPPLFFWLIASASIATDGVTVASTRLPSVLATILTALLLFEVGRRSRGTKTGLVSGAMYLVTFSVIEKGAFGELESVFTLAVFAATAALYAASCGARWASWGAGLALCAALLIKGPPAFVFFGAAAIAIAITRGQTKFLWSKTLWVPIIAAVLVASIWVFRLLARPEVNDVIATWSDQLNRGDGGGFSAYLNGQKELAGGVLAGFFPPSLIALFAIGTSTSKGVLQVPVLRYSLVLVMVGLLFFGVMPGTQVRYVHPLIPWGVLFASGLLVSGVETREVVFARRTVRLGWLLAVIGFAVVGGSVWLQFRSIAGIRSFGLIGTLLVLILAVASVQSWRWWKVGLSNRALVSSFCVLGLLRLIQLQEIVPQGAGRHGRVVQAATISAPLGEDEPLYLIESHLYNLLFYMKHPVLMLPGIIEVPAQGFVLLRRVTYDKVEREAAVRFRVVLDLETHEGEELRLIQVLS